MSVAFDRAFWVTLNNEGGYVNHPADRGGPTNLGITQRTFDAWRRSQYKPVESVQNLTQDEARRIYEERYFDAAHCDEMPMRLAVCVFDAAVHHGPQQAIRFLQMVLDVPDDGIYTSATRQALDDELEHVGEQDIIRRYLDYRSEFLAALAERPGQEVFGRGWQNRVDRLSSLLLGTPVA